MTSPKRLFFMSPKKITYFIILSNCSSIKYMAIDFLAGSVDYLIFLRGLLFILAGMFCWLIKRADQDRRAFGWLGFFAWGQGLGELTDILAVSLGDGPYFVIFGFGLSLITYVFLAVFIFGWAGTTGKTIVREKMIVGWALLIVVLDWLTGGFMAAGWLRSSGIFPVYQIPGFSLQLLRLAVALGFSWSIWRYSRHLYRDLIEANNRLVRRPYTRLIMPLLLLVILGGWLATEMIGRREDARLRQGVLRRVQTAAAADLLAAERTRRLSGTTADLAQPYYQRLKEELILVRSVNPDVHFVYFMGLKDGQVFFFVDSEPAGAKDYSPPGQVYEEASPALREAFRSGQPFTEGPTTDRWGTWISGLVPIVDKQDDRIVAVLGMDLDARAWGQQIAINRTLPIAITCFIVLMLLMFFIAIRSSEEDTARIWLAEEDVKNAYDKLKKTEAQLVQSAKMSVVGQLAGGVAHEINNPLTSILAHVEVIRRRVAQESPECAGQLKDFLRSIEDDVTRCKKITDSLMDFAFGTEEPVGQIDLNRAVENALAILNYSLEERRIVIKKELAEGLPGLPMNYQLIQQIIFNLVDNAAWAIGQKTEQLIGQIIISTGLAADGKCLELSVADNGIGISAKDQNQVFEPFFTKKRVGEGSGLGLSIIYGLVKDQGGSIRVESSPEQGAKFIVSFKI